MVSLRPFLGRFLAVGLADRMTLGALMAFLAYLAMFYAPLTSLSALGQC